MLVGAGLILTGKVQVDIRHLAASVAQKRLKGDVKAVLDVLLPADGAHLVRHIRAAAIAAVSDEFRVLALRAAVVGRQGVHLRDARHVRHQTGAHGATGAHQIAVFQTALHQLLGGHVHHVVLAQNTLQLHVQPVDDQLGWLVAVQLVALVPHHVVQLLLGVLQPGREQLARRQQLDVLDAVCNAPGIVDDHPVGRLRPQIGELLQHLVGGLEVDGQRRVGVREFLAGQQDMAVHLVLRLLKMHVACGAHRLAQLLAQPDDGAVELPQLLLRLHVAVAQHEHVVADGLYLQIVVERRDALQLRPVLVVGHGPEQLARLAGRADDEPLPVGRQLRLGDGGHALEVFQIGRRDQLVQMLQPQLVLGQNDDVLGEPGLAAPGPQLQHLAVDLLQAVDAQLPLHLLKKRDEHIAHHGRVVGGPVVVEGGQIQMLRHDVQLVLAQLRQQVLRQNEGVHIGGIEVQPHLSAARPDEADVELRVVCRQRAAVDEPQERRQRLLQLGRIGQHSVRDAGQADDLRRQPPVGVHKGLEPLRDLAVFQHHRTDLGDGLPFHLQARRLDVEAHDLVGKRLLLRAMYGDAVVQIVDEIALHAVEDLDLPLARVPGLGERLHRAVVGDGDGGMAPRRRLLHHLAHIREGVHGAHLGMQVQLHPLLRGRVLPSLVLDAHDAHRLQLQVFAVEGQRQLGQYPQPHAVADGAAQHLGLLLVHVLPDGHGAVLIGHVEAQAPLAGPAPLVALHTKDPALHHGHAHFQIQLRDGDGLALDLLAAQQVAAALARHRRRGEVQLHPPQAVLLSHHLLQRLHRRVRQCLTADGLYLNGTGLPIQHTAGDIGVMQQQTQLARCLKTLKQCKKR